MKQLAEINLLDCLLVAIFFLFFLDTTWPVAICLICFSALKGFVFYFEKPKHDGEVQLLGDAVKRLSSELHALQVKIGFQKR